MEQITTSASGEKDARKITLEYNFGDNTADAVKIFGEEVVFSNFKAQAKVRFQALVRADLKEGKKDGEIAEKMASWKPSIAKPGKSAVEKTEAAWDKLSPAEQKALLSKLMKRAK